MSTHTLSKRINISLPASTAKLLNQTVPRGERSSYLSDLVLNDVIEKKKADMRKRLAEGAIARREEDKAMCEEWLPLEEEAWLTFERQTHDSKKG